MWAVWIFPGAGRKQRAEGGWEEGRGWGEAKIPGCKEQGEGVGGAWGWGGLTGGGRGWGEASGGSGAAAIAHEVRKQRPQGGRRGFATRELYFVVRGCGSEARVRAPRAPARRALHGGQAAAKLPHGLRPQT